jgi:predicted nuclease of restriction endonuclease-like (RecB) superfamily
MIVTRQQGETWGRSIVQRLAADLRSEFPGVSGFSAQNLWRMRQFYETYAGSEKLSPLVREIGWTHNVIILMNCKDCLQREFYIRMTRKFGWAKNLLTQSNKRIGVGTYCIVTELPAELQGQLPSAEQIARLLEGIE